MVIPWITGIPPASSLTKTLMPERAWMPEVEKGKQRDVSEPEPTGNLAAAEKPKGKQHDGASATTNDPLDQADNATAAKD